jgi:HEAT repeat protein
LREEEVEEMVKRLEEKRGGIFRKTRRVNGIEEEKYMDPLLKAFEGDDENLRKLAEVALGTFNRPMLGHPTQDLKGEIDYFQKLAQVALRSEEKLSGKAREKKARKDKKSLASLINELKNEDPEERHEIILTIGNMGVAAIEPLITALKEEDWFIRAGSALALGMIGESAIESLIQTLESEDWDTRRRAAQALGWIGDKRAIPALIKRLNDGNDHVRMGAADALANIGDTRGKAALTKFLKETRFKVNKRP